MPASPATSQAGRTRLAFLDACLRSDHDEVEADILLSRRGREMKELLVVVRDRLTKTREMDGANGLDRGDARLLEEIKAGLRDPEVLRGWFANGFRRLRKMIERSAFVRSKTSRGQRSRSNATTISGGVERPIPVYRGATTEPTPAKRRQDLTAARTLQLGLHQIGDTRWTVRYQGSEDGVKWKAVREVRFPETKSRRKKLEGLRGREAGR